MARRIAMAVAGIALGVFSASDVRAVTFNWSARAPMPTPRWGMAIAELGGLIYVTAGDGSKTQLERYDPFANTWTTLAPLPSGRFAPAGVAVSGTFYVIGGGTGTLVHAYDPATNSWTAKAPMPTARESLGAVAVGGYIYAIGGYGSSASNANERYDPVANTWTAMAPMPTARQSLAVMAWNGKIYCIGGALSYGSGFFSTVEIYDPGTNTWTTGTPMPTARDALTAAVAEDRMVVAGGRNVSVAATNFVEVYNPDANTWEGGSSLPTARAFAGLAMSDGKIFVIGGTQWSGGLGVNEAAVIPGFGLLRKDAVPAGPVCAGATLDWIVSWRNTGTQTLVDFTVTDTLPAGVSYQAPSLGFWAQPDDLGIPALVASAWATAAAGPWTPGEPANGAQAPLLLRWVVNRVAPVRSGMISFTAVSATSLANGTVIMNRASATAFGSSSLFESSQPSTVVQKASLAAGMSTSPPTPVETRQVQVVLTVTNTGSVSIPSVTPVIGINAGAPLVALASGPVPASASIAPGAGQSFTWMYTVNGVGTIRWTATGAGLDACGLAVAAAASASTLSTSVEGALAATPNPAPQGTTFTVAFTVTNYGAASASGATAVLGISSGGGNVAYVSGPVPATGVGIPPSGAQTWIWTYSATGTCGVVVFSATATATDTGSGLTVSARGSVNVTLPGDAWDPGDDTGPGGTLLVTTTTYQTHGPHVICASDSTDWYRIPMLAGAVYNLTTAAPGSSGDNIGNLYSNAAGTIQVGAGDDEGGNAQFSITYTGGVTQDYYLRVRHYTPGSTWNGNLRYRSVPASLKANMTAVPAQSVAGRWVQVVLTVSNTGGMATAVAPFIETNSGGALLTYIAGPVPASAAISYGGNASFTWTYSVNGGGLIQLTATATGSDLASGMIVATAGSGSVFTTSLAAAAAVTPPSVSAGQWANLTLTVTNTGLADVSGVTPAVQVNTGAGLVSLVSGPVPPGPVSLTPGTAQTFVWTWSASAGGAVSFTATASGLDTGSGYTVTGSATRPLAVAIGLAEAVDNLTLTWTTGGSSTWYAQTTIFTFGGDAAQSGDIADSQSNWIETTVTGPGTVTFWWKVDSEGGYDYLTFLIDGSPQTGAISGNITWAFKTYPVAAGVHTLRWRYSKDSIISSGADAGWVDQVVWTPLILTSALAVTPASPAIGQWAQIVLTVTNGGAANVTGITPAIQVNAGSALVVYQSGPVPTGPLTLVPGAAQSFTWTYSASGAGSVNLTATATGIDSGTSNPTSAASTRVFTVLAPAQLRAALAIAPVNASAGEWFTVRLTVTNSGGVSATGVLPALDLNAGGALLAAVAGPVPPGPLTLAGGAAQTFVWTWSVTAGGPVAFTATATGADAVSGAPLTATAYRAGPVTSLRVALEASPPVAAPGFPVEVAVTVTVTGVATVTGVTPTIQFNAGGANFSYLSGPVPASAGSITPGGSQTFVWTYNVTTAGAVALTATVTGTDTLGGAAVTAAASRLTQVRRVLFYGPNNDGNMQLAPGISVTIVSEATWKTMTVADFAQYDAIAVGETPSGSATASWTSLWMTRTTWGAAVTGNIFVFAGDPLLHAKPLVGQQAVLYACDDALPGPGLAVALRAVYESVSTPSVPILSHYGAFAAGPDGCPSIVRVNGSHPQLAALTDAYLAYGCASHGSFDSWPGEFNPFAIGTNGTLGGYVAPDGTVGRVFMLRRDGTTDPPMLRKTATARTTPAGTITYALDWTNLTAATHTNLTLTDTLPAGTRWIAGSTDLWAQSDDAGTPSLQAAAWASSAAGPWTAGEPADGTATPLVLRWVVNRVAPGRSGVLRFTVRAGAVVPGGLVVNRVSATVWGNAQAASSQLATTYVDGSLLVHKSAAPAGPVNAGGVLAYTLSWSNPNAATVINLTLTDTLPNGTAWAAGSVAFFAQSDGFGTPVLSASAWSASSAGPWIAGEPPDGTASPAVIRWVVDRVAPGRSGSISFGVTVSATLAMGATISNRASATVWSDGFVYATEEPIRSVTFPIGMAAALAVTPNPAVTGETVQVALTTTNTGVTTVSGITPALQINFGGAGVLLLGGPVPPTVASLPVGNAVTFVWTFSVTGGGAVSFTGTVTGTNGAGATGAAATAVLVAVSGACGPPPDQISTVAGNFGSGYNGDFLPALSAWLNNPTGTAVDAAGNLYIADNFNNRIRRVDAGTGQITTVAGDGSWGYNGDGFPAVFSWLANPSGVALDAAGNLYIADRSNQRIRRVDTGSGLIWTVAGDGNWGYIGDGMPAPLTWLADPYGVAVDPAGNMYIADTGNGRIRRVDAGTGIIQTIAGDFPTGYNGDGIPATAAWLNWPTGVAVDASDNVYIADNSNQRIRRVDAGSGLISTVAGTGLNGFGGDGGSGSSALVAWPFGVSVDSACRVFIADSNNNRIRRLDPPLPLPDMIAGLSFTPNPAAVGGTVQIRLTTTNTGATTVTGVVPALQVNAGAGNVTLIAGPVPPSMASLTVGNAVTFVWTFSVTGGGVVSFTGTVTGTNGSGATGAVATRILAVPSGSCVAVPVTISTVAGTLSSGYNGDGIAANTAWLNNPLQSAVDSAGNVYIADQMNHRIRRVDAGTGVITTVAGTGTAGYNADGIAATSAWLASPSGVALDLAGNLYIADRGNERIRRVDAGTGMISTVAGNGTPGYSGEGLPATSSSLGQPYGITVDPAGHVYLAEQANNRVRRVDAGTGLITTVAGTGIWGYNGDGIPATTARLSDPIGVAFDSAGNMYIADVSADRIRRVDAGSGLISTVAGTGTPGYNGDGIPANTATLTFPAAVAVDASDNLYIADTNNNRIRRVDAGTGVITTVAGTGTASFGGDGGPGPLADVDGPWGVAVDGSCRVYIADSGNNRIRRLDPPPCPPLAYTLGLQRTPANPGIGDAVTYLLSLANTGTATITSVRISDTLAAALVNVTIQGPAPATITDSPAGGTVYFWNVAPALINPGMTVTITITGRVALVCAPTVIGNTVWVGAAGDCGAPVEATVSASPLKVSPPVTWLRVSKTQSPVSPVTGQAVTYRIVVRNAGTATLTNLDIADTVSPVLMNVATAQSAGVSAPAISQLGLGAGTLYVWSGPALFGPGQVLTVTITGMVGPVCAPTVVANTVWVGAAGNCVPVIVAQAAAGSFTVNSLIATAAGTGVFGYNGDGIAATTAQVRSPRGVAVDGAGNVYIADADNHRIRMVSAATGLISTVAGDGTGGYNGDGIAATTARLNVPYAIAVDRAGNLYIADYSNARVRMVTAATGLISTVAGTGTVGYNGDGIAATTAQLNTPLGVGVDLAGNVYIPEFNGHRVRKVSVATGVITTVAGTGAAGYNGDGIAATTAQLQNPRKVALDDAGNLYIADANNQRVRRVDAASGFISTVAGTGTLGYNGDGIAATSAQLGTPLGIALDQAGNLFIAESNGQRIRLVDAETGLIATVAGTGTGGYNGDGIPAVLAELNSTEGVAVDGTGNLYLTDSNNQRVRRVGREIGFIVAPAVSAISVTTWMTPALPVATGPVAYTIVVANTGSATLTSLTVTDTLSARITGAAAVSNPAPFGPPVIAGIAGGGTHFQWSATGLSFAPGQTFTFTITGTVGVAATPGTAGTTAFVAAGFPCGGLTAARPGETFFLAQTVALSATLNAQPVLVSTGQSFLVTMDATNAGAGTGTNASATIWRDPVSTGGVGFSGLSAPAGGSIASGGRLVFTWTATALSAGNVVFTGTAYTNEHTTGPVSAGAVTIQNAANLVAGAPVVSQSTICTATTFAVHVPVTNAGQAAANGVTATIWLASGPAAAVSWGLPNQNPVAIAGGQTIVFTWTVSGLAAGTVTLTASASGTDANSGAQPNTSQVTTAPVTVTTPGVLIGALAGPAAANVGSPVTLSFSVTNTGGTAITMAMLSATTTAGTGMFGTPSPASAGIGAGLDEFFTVTYTPLSAGVHEFSVTVAGGSCAAVVATAATGTLTATTPAALSLAAFTANASSTCLGETYAVHVVVGNSGGTGAVSVSPTLWVSSGPVAGLPGPNPATATIAGGQNVVFTWTITALAGGVVTYTATVAGLDANTGSPVTNGPVAGPSVAVSAPATLVAAVYPPPAANVSTPVTVVFTATNTGGSAATGVSFTMTTTAGRGIFGALAPAPVTLAGGGGGQSFSVSYTPLTAGVHDFSVTASGGTCLTVVSSPATGSLTATTPAALSGTLIVTLPVSGLTSIGGLVVVTLTVTNTGGTTANTVGPAALTPVGVAGTLAGPTQVAGGASLAGGGMAAWVWTFTATGAGSLTFNTSAAGTDANTAAAVDTGVLTTGGPVTVQAPAALAGALSVPAGPVCPATQWLVQLTVTNTGQATANGVTPATPVETGAGAATLSGYPTPAPGLALAGGAAVTFTWTATGTLFGGVTFTGSVSGTDANSGAIAAATGVTAPLLTISPPPSVGVALTRIPASPQPGGAVTWRWIVTNTSTATLTNLELVDTLPAGFTYTGESSLPVLGHAAVGAVHTWTGAVILAPGVTATVSLDATAPCVVGTVTVTGYARGTALCGTAANAPAPNIFTLATPGSLAAAAFGPATVSVGQPFTVSLSATNSGGADVTGIVPAAAAGPGAGLVTMGPGTPAGPLAWAAGAGQSFGWAVTATGAGSVTFTLSVNGLACAGTSPVTGAGYRTVTIQTPAALVGALSVDPATVAVGGLFAIRLTVTNTGQADAMSVSPVLPTGFGTGSAAYTAGPNPNTPVPLATGAAITFTWTFTASSSGSVSYSSTASGLDANAGWPVTTGAVTSNALTITSAPALTAWLAFSRTTASTGQDVNVTLSVSNSGTTAAPNTTAALWQSGGAGGGVLAGPSPAATASLPGGATVTYSWTLTAGPAGMVNLTATATSSWPVTSPAATGPVLVQTPAALAARVAEMPSSVCTGQSVLVMVTVTNTGQAVAQSVISLLPDALGTGAATYTEGPTPAGPVTLGGGGSITFTYTFTASSSGSVSFASTASGSDANTTNPVSAVATASSPVSIGAPGTIAAQLAVPANASTGQWITVTVTATLTGGAAVAGLAPDLSLTAGAGTVIAGPVPATSALSITGTGAVFSWTVSVSGAGTLAFSVTLAGATCASPAAPLAVAGAVTAAVNRAALAAASALSATTLTPGQARTITLTVTNTANAPGAAALSVTPSLLIAGPGVLITGPVPASAASVGAGASQTFAWTVSASGAGTITLTPSVIATDQHGGWTMAATAPARVMESYVPGSVVIDAFGLTPGPNVRFTETMTATLTLRNPGQSPVQVTLGALTESGPGPWLLDPAAGYPGAPFTLAAGQTTTVPWTHLANGSCGFTGLSVTVTATETDFGAQVPDVYAATATLGIAGVPASLAAVAEPAKVLIRGTTAVIVTVTDACGVPVPGATVDLALIAPPPGALLTPGTAVTDATGRVQGVMTVGSQPGVQRARADAGGAPSVTILVEATAPDDPAAFLSQNFFNPARGERLKIRVLLPAAMPLAVRVYNLAGEPIAKIAEGESAAGLTILEWDGRNQSGDAAANGVYFIQTVSGAYRDVRRVIVLRR